MMKRYGTGWFLAGGALARTGDETAGPALLLAGFALTGSPATASLLLAALAVPAVLGGPLLGVLLDRAPRPGRLLAACLLLYALGLALAAAGAGRVPTVVTLACAAAAGLFAPALAGGWSAQLPYVTDPGGLPAATARDAATFHLASLAGPALTGALAAWTFPSAPAALAVTLLLLAVPVAWWLPAPGGRAGADAGAGTGRRAPDGRSGAAGLRAGLRLTSRDRACGAPPRPRCSPARPRGCWRPAPRHWGARPRRRRPGVALLAAVALAALAANAVLARCPLPVAPGALLRWTALVQGAALLLAATCRPGPVAAAALLAGVGEGPQLSALFAVRHRVAPARLRAQLFTVGASLKTTAFAAGAALAGQLAAPRSRPGCRRRPYSTCWPRRFPGTGSAGPGRESGERPTRPAGGEGGDDGLRHAVRGERVLRRRPARCRLGRRRVRGPRHRPRWARSGRRGSACRAREGVPDVRRGPGHAGPRASSAAVGRGLGRCGDGASVVSRGGLRRSPPRAPPRHLTGPEACLVRGHVLELSRHRDIYPWRDRDRRR
ncbi:MFS transporter [Streptomyces sp. S399]|uniref:MFS transporter n=1 Tax=Streptomyces sp. S399 TaxID=3096009 RepID=UPI002A7FFDFE|nr:MFS transporter [Streptomyces sp. S399]WPR53788.1 MFS transporter [Streptomyces sp. S399]